MYFLIFVLISVAVFITVTIAGIVILYCKKDTFSNGADVCQSDKMNKFLLASAIPSPNKYVDFDEILDVVARKYANSYNAAGQVYNEKSK